jgi:hypothetical protein
MENPHPPRFLHKRLDVTETIHGLDKPRLTAYKLHFKYGAL